MPDDPMAHGHKRPPDVDFNFSDPSNPLSILHQEPTDICWLLQSHTSQTWWNIHSDTSNIFLFFYSLRIQQHLDKDRNYLSNQYLKSLNQTGSQMRWHCLLQQFTLNELFLRDKNKKHKGEQNHRPDHATLYNWQSNWRYRMTVDKAKPILKQDHTFNGSKIL